MIVPPIHVITPVWGAAFTRCFLDIGLTSLLSPGNLPGLAAQPRNVVHLFTTATDFEVIEKSPVWSLAEQVVDCRLEIIGANAVNIRDPHETMSLCHRKAIEAADAAGAAMLFYNPDIVIADGGMRALVRLLAAGKRAIQVVGLRLQKEEVVPLLLRDHVSPDRTNLVISPRELMALAMPHLHPITKMHLDGADDYDLMPSQVYWRAGDSGLVARCFHIHPILVYPRVRNAAFTTTIDDDYLRAACPDHEDEYFIADSDEFCLCELSSMQRLLHGLRRQPDNRDVAEWAWSTARPHHLEHFSRRIILHAGEIEGPEWAVALSRCDDAAKRIFEHLLDFEIRAGFRN
jgi:hypothetical protein